MCVHITHHHMYGVVIYVCSPIWFSTQDTILYIKPVNTQEGDLIDCLCVFVSVRPRCVCSKFGTFPGGALHPCSVRSASPKVSYCSHIYSLLFARGIVAYPTKLTVLTFISQP